MVMLTSGLDTKTSYLGWSQALCCWKLPTRSFAFGFGFGFSRHPAEREASNLPVSHVQVRPACQEGIIDDLQLSPSPRA